jgi:AraC-like DNA-binding protein
MEVTLINIIELIAAFQSVLFVVFLLSSNKRKSKSNYFISIFLLLFAINLLQEFTLHFIEPISANLYSFINLTFFLLPASLFLYNKSVLISEFKLSKKSLLHIVPYLLVNIIVIPFVYLENLKEVPVESPVLKYILAYYYIFFYTLLFGYQYFSFKLLRNNKQVYFENFSNNNIQRYKYLRYLNIIFTFLFCISAIKNFLVFNIDVLFINSAIIFVNLTLLFFVCWVAYTGFSKPFVFAIPMDKLAPVRDLITINKSEKISIQDNKLLEKVKEVMDSEEPFLDASLTIQGLAEKLQIPTKELSILINHQLNQHFFDFVNEYRIKKAMELLRNPKNEKITILEVLYEVGFNSKSSFNTAFKKHTGITPTEYKKKAMLSVA